jgi:general secretion pathway protein F
LKTYSYRGFDREGRARRGLVEASGAKGAREQLAADGILVERLNAGRERARGLDRGERAAVYRELGALAEAGLPVVQALDTLIDAPELAGERVLMAAVRDRIKEGSTLAAAFRATEPSVSAFETAMLETGERSGTLGPMLGRLADVLEEQEQMRGRVVSALIYPAIVVALGLCVAIVMLGVLLPRTRVFLAQSGVPLPALTRFMLGVGRFMAAWGLLALCGAVGAGFVLRHRLRTQPEARLRLDQRLFSVPLVAHGYRLLACMHFARTLAVLLRAGVTLIEGMVLAGRATGSAWVAAQVEGEAETVKHGGRLSDAVSRIPPLAGSLPGWIRVGEAGGGMASLLDAAAERYRLQWERFVARGLSLLEPLLIIVIGGFVLLIALSVLLPVLSLTQVAGR